MTTPRLGLASISSDSPIDSDALGGNFDAIDAAPGALICTSSTRPVGWGANQNGRLILESDTGLLWRWDNGAGQFVRMHGKGILGSNNRTSNISTNSTGFAVVVSQTIAIPAGGRPVIVGCSVPAVQSDVGLTNLALYRDTTKLTDWLVPGSTGSLAAEQEPCGSNMVLDTPLVGSYAYSLQFRAVTGYGGTSTLLASATAPIQIWVDER